MITLEQEFYEYLLSEGRKDKKEKENEKVKRTAHEIFMAARSGTVPRHDPATETEPNSKERMKQIRDMMKTQGASAILKHVKKEKKQARKQAKESSQNS
jgi:hypothetical protein